jgi:4-hydroxybenzoyl-CoA reductase subunit beta
MRLPRFRYLEPRSLEEAVAFLGEHGNQCKIIGGGTDLLPSMKQGIFKPAVLLSPEKIPDLDKLEWDDLGGLRLGPLVRIRTLETDPRILQRYPMVHQAARVLASPQLRFMGTVGGNLSLDTRCYYYNQSDSWRKSRPRCIKMGGEVCNAIGGGKKCFAVFSSDLAPVFVALEARVKLLSQRGERTLPLYDYYSGNGAKPIFKEPDEMLVSVEIPPPPEGVYTTYLKYRIRKSIDFPLASLAAVLSVDKEEKVCRKAKIVIGGVGSRPQEVKEISRLLAGKKVDEAMIADSADLGFKAARPVANQASSPEYRRLMIKFLVKKALKQAAQV